MILDFGDIASFENIFYYEQLIYGFSGAISIFATELGWQAWVTLGVIILMMIALIRGIGRPDMIVAAALTLLLGLGILPPDIAFAGFSNPAMLSVASLFVVAAGVQNTGTLQFTERLLFGRSRRLTVILGKLMFTVAGMSAFLNNTPIVAMLTPRIHAWGERTGIPVSKLMMPLSFAAILGGMTTLIGTSTNLLVSGLMQARSYEGLGIFDLTWVALPAAIAAISYMTLIGHRLLPDSRKDRPTFRSGLENCLFEVRIAEGAALIGKTIGEAKLRSLINAYLAHVRRGGEVVQSSPETVLRANDVLAFLGDLGLMDKLLARDDFQRVVPEIEERQTMTLPLYEAVVSPASRLVGKTLRETGFREQYQGVVLGIQRREKTFAGPLANIPIKVGDLLIIEARNGFDHRWNERRDDFVLVAPRRAERAKTQTSKAPIAALILLGVIAVAALGWLPIVTTSIVGALAMVVTGCLPGDEARKAIDIPILVVIASALGIGQALTVTGLAQTLADKVAIVAGFWGPIGAIAAVYLATNLLTEIITNNAAAALTLTTALSVADKLSLPPKALAITVAIAASASFMTPIGYQTNLMVMSAGGYRFSDYLRSGATVNIVVALVSIMMIKIIWL
jgi:di/tricarboxylate transporter